MGVSYKPLLKLLIDRNMKKTDLSNILGLSPTTVAKIAKNERISTENLEKICSYFKCQFSDVIEYVDEK